MFPPNKKTPYPWENNQTQSSVPNYTNAGMTTTDSMPFNPIGRPMSDPNVMRPKPLGPMADPNPTKPVGISGSRSDEPNVMVNPFKPTTNNYVNPVTNNPSTTMTAPNKFAGGYNPGQWEINKRFEDIANRNEAGGTGYGYGMNRQSWLKSQPGYLENLPDQAEYQAYQAEQLRPFNDSVQRERAAGRPGHSGEIVPQNNSNVPNYTNPSAQSMNPSTAAGASGLSPAIQQLLDQLMKKQPDTYQGTQRRTPSYF